MLATLVGGVLVLGWTITLVNRYLARREQKRWLLTAAAAFADLGRVARATWVQLSVTGLKLTTITDQQSVPALRDKMLSAERQANLLTETTRLARDPGGRAKIFRELHKVVATTRETLALWTPIMVTQPDDSELLSRFADLLRREVKLLGILSVEVTAGVVPNESPEDIGQRLASVIALAEAYDRDLFRIADDLAPDSES